MRSYQSWIQDRGDLGKELVEEAGQVPQVVPEPLRCDGGVLPPLEGVGMERPHVGDVADVA